MISDGQVLLVDAYDVGFPAAAGHSLRSLGRRRSEALLFPELLYCCYPAHTGALWPWHSTW